MTARQRNALLAQLFVSVDELASLLPISAKSVYRSIEDGTIPAEKIRGRLVISTAWVRDWAQAGKKKKAE